MAEVMRVDPIDLHIASDHMTVAADEYATDIATHMDDFTDGVARWSGPASRTALHDAAATWEINHAQHQRRVTTLGQHVTDAAHRYTTTDSELTQAIDSVPMVGSDNSTLACDMGF